jgi:hypothetical protein
VTGAEKAMVVGVDLVAAFALADALGVNKFALAEFFPAMEAALVRRMNEQITGGGEQPMLGMADDDAG